MVTKHGSKMELPMLAADTNYPLAASHTSANKGIGAGQSWAVAANRG
jgi:hypothetical protein